MAVFEKVQEIIVEELGKDAEEVKVETTLTNLMLIHLMYSKLSQKSKMNSIFKSKLKKVLIRLVTLLLT